MGKAAKQFHEFNMMFFRKIIIFCKFNIMEKYHAGYERSITRHVHLNYVGMINTNKTYFLLNILLLRWISENWPIQSYIYFVFEK